MFSHYTRIFLRILWKNKVLTLIHVLGLVVGMTSAVLIAKYIEYSLTFDNFQQNRDKIFLLQQTEWKNGHAETIEGLTYRGIATIACQTFPEIVNYTKFELGVERLVIAENESGEITSNYENRIAAVDSSFLQMFTFKALLGNRENALSQPYSAVITNSMSEKYFGDTNPIGRTLTTRVSWGKEMNWTITCVLEDLPKNSGIRFDMLVSNSFDNANLWDMPVYHQFILTSGITPSHELSGRISNHISSLPLFKENGRKISVMLKPLTPSLATFEFMLAFIGLFILALSWIIFINQFIAHSLNRLGEMAIKKVVGSSNKQLVGQFVFESLLINCIALLLTILVLTLSYDYFTDLSGDHLLPLFDNSLHVNTLILIVFVIGSILASLYPSFSLVSRKMYPLSKNPQKTNQAGRKLRKGLVGVQFIISSVMIIGTYVIASQMDYMMSADLGFNPKNKLIIKPPIDGLAGKRNRMFAIKKEFAKRSWVESLTTSSTIPGQSYRQEVYFSLKDSGERALLYINGVDSGFVRTYGMKILAGTDFSRDGGRYATEDKVMINEVAAHALGLSPDDAIDRQLVDHENNEVFTIIGVVENYHKTSLKESIEPIILKYNNRRGYIAMVLSSNDAHPLQDKISELKEIWQTVYRDQPFEYFFLTDKFSAQYRAETFFRKVFNVFTYISIFLACLGLIGLALFESINSRREVGIRKTFGASSISILVFFIKKYLRILLIATAVGAPISYYIMDSWLDEYSHRILLGLNHFLFPIFILFLVALFTIAIQMFKLSMINPAKIFREE